jgi:cyclophilin family peptidyl-prolyl cis-trans isomerase
MNSNRAFVSAIAVIIIVAVLLQVFVFAAPQTYERSQVQCTGNSYYHMSDQRRMGEQMMNGGMMGGPMMNGGNQGYEQFPNEYQVNFQPQMMYQYCHE